MEVYNVKKHNPGYPTKDKAFIDPDLLRSTPNRWKGLFALGTVLSISVLSSCQNQSPGQFVRNLFNNTPSSQVLMGDVMVVPTVLSEQEAIDIILDEASKHGIDFDVVDTKQVIAKIPVNIELDEEL